MSRSATQILQDCLDRASEVVAGAVKHKSSLTKDDKDSIAQVVNSATGGVNKAVLAVLVTLLVKKIMDTKQDIRLHQDGMRDGFSGRVFDTKNITPFLSENDFPYMQSGSGWLTRSFEQAVPYDLDYPGKITPAKTKTAFLQLLDNVEKDQKLARQYLDEIFIILVQFREKSTDLTLSRPKNKSIEELVAILENFWGQKGHGMSRVPVLAVYAAYKCLEAEVGRYEGHTLLPLLSHTAADEKTKRAGDIDLMLDSKIVESVEIKHGVAITADLVLTIIEKVKTTSVKRYYILSTDEDIKEIEKISNLITKARLSYGCEIIVNGVAKSLKYYLRLVSNTDNFLDIFVTLLQEDKEIAYDAKKTWDEIMSRGV